MKRLWVILLFVSVVIATSRSSADIKRVTKDECSESYCFRGSVGNISVDIQLLPAIDDNGQILSNIFKIVGTIYSQQLNSKTKTSQTVQCPYLGYTTNTPATSTWQNCGDHRISTYGSWSTPTSNGWTTLSLHIDDELGWKTPGKASVEILTVKSAKAAKPIIDLKN